MEPFSPLHMQLGWERHMERFNEGIEAIYAIERVRELHKPTGIRGVTNEGVAYEYTGCMECWEHTPEDNRTFVVSHVEYPCSTIKALDGETNG